MNNNDLFLDALTDISMHVGYQYVRFDDFKVRNATLRSWAQDFVQRYTGSDWQQMDYTVLVGEFAVEKVNQYRKLYQQSEISG